MCRYHQCLSFSVPEGKQPICYFIEERPEFPDFFSIQFLEQFPVLLSLLYSTDIVANLLPCLFRYGLDEAISFRRLYQPKYRLLFNFFFHNELTVQN